MRDSIIREFCRNLGKLNPTTLCLTPTPHAQALLERPVKDSFDPTWTAHVRSFAGNSGNASSSSGSGAFGNSSRGYKSSSQGRKRSRDEAEDHSLGGNDRNPNNPRPCRAVGEGDEITFRFACPFHKHDPVRYNVHDYRTCAISAWGTIWRLR
jgi:hypothetical protein